MLRIHYADYEALRAHGEETYPNECCGVLLGKTSPAKAITSTRSSAPATPAPTPRTTATTSLRRSSSKSSARPAASGSTSSASTTRTPTIPPQWSPTDFAEAHWLGCSYVITSVEKGKAVITNSFLLLGTSRGRQKV